MTSLRRTLRTITFAIAAALPAAWAGAQQTTGTLPQPVVPQPSLPQPALPQVALPQPALPQPGAATPKPAPARRPTATPSRSGAARGAAATPRVTPPAVPPTVHLLDKPTSESLPMSLDQLLADPVAASPELRWLDQERAWLARKPKPTLEDFVQVASEFEDRGAYYPAIEILWFAEKGSQKPENRKALNAKMAALIEKSKLTDNDVDAAMQQWAAGRSDAGRQAFDAVIRLHPFCERAYFQLGLAIYKDYRAIEDKSDAALPPLAVRARTFRDCYACYVATLAVDPFYTDNIAHDPWYQINLLRMVMPDRPEFLQRTEILSHRAASFRGEVVPRLDALDNGDRSAKTLGDLSEALESVGRNDYAIFAAQCALNAEPPPAADAAKALTARIENLRKLLPAAPPPAPAAAGPKK